MQVTMEVSPAEMLEMWSPSDTDCSLDAATHILLTKRRRATTYIDTLLDANLCIVVFGHPHGLVQELSHVRGRGALQLEQEVVSKRGSVGLVVPKDHVAQNNDDVDEQEDRHIRWRGRAPRTARDDSSTDAKHHAHNVLRTHDGELLQKQGKMG